MADQVKLSSLRVTADMDVSRYVRAAGEKSAADARMAESSQALGRALAAADAASDRASTASAKISRAWIDGYGAAARFEKALRDIGRAMDTGMDAGRASAALDGLYRRFGMVADASALAKQGFVSLAPVVDGLNQKLAAMDEIGRRAVAVQSQVQRAAAMQTGIDSRLGIGRPAYDAAGAGATFEAQFAAERKALEARAKALTQTHLPELAELERNRTVRKEIIAIEQAGLVPRARALEMLAAERVHHTQNIDAIRRVASAQQAMATGAGLARHEYINLSRQIQDVGVSLASGQSPFTVMVQQGSQIADIFATSRASIGEVFKGGVMWAARFATSVAGVTTAIAGAAAGVAYLGASYSSSMRGIDLAMTGRGRASGMSASDIAAVGREVGASGPLSISEARGIAGQLAGAGTIDRSLITELTKAAHPLSLITGGKLEDAGKSLTEAFMDPARGAQTLGMQLGVTNAALLDYIRNAQAAGNLPDAQRALFKAMSPRLQAASAKEGWGSRLTTGIGNFFSNYGQRAGAEAAGLIPIDEQLKDLQAKIAKQEKFIADNPLLSASARSNLGDLKAQEEKLREDVRRETAERQKESKETYANITSEQGAAVIRGVVDDIGRLQALKSQKSVIDAVIGDPAKFAALSKEEQGAAQTASDRIGAMLGAFGTAASRAAEDGQLQVRAIMAVTVADRAGVEAERARLEAIRATGDASLAAVQAENARTRVIAEANRQIRDGLRDAVAQSRLVGLADGPRRIQELRNRQEQERLTLGMGGATPAPSTVAGIFATFRAKVDSLLGAMGDAGARVTGAAASAPIPRGAAGLDPEFQRRLSAFFAALPGLTITSGFRTFEQQAALYAQKPGWAAPPGSSNHERGLAADLALGPGMTWADVHARAAEFGLRFPMKDRAVRPEAWHVEMTRGSAEVGGLRAGANDNALATKHSTEYANLLGEMESGPLVQSRQALAGMNAQYNTLRGSIGATEREQASLNEQARLQAEYARASVAVTPQMAAEIQKLGNEYGDAAERLRLFNFEKKQSDEWRSFEAEATKGFAHDVVNGLRQGENAWRAFGNAAVNALNKIADKAIDSLFDRMFAMNKGGGGGLFASVFGGLFGGGGGGVSAWGATNALGPWYADGAAFAAGTVIPFATGDVLSRPTYFPMAGGRVGLMGEAGPEAIMPLGRGRDGKLGVRMSGGGGGAMTYAPTINVSGDVSAETVDMLRAELRASEARAAAMMRNGLEASIADEPKRAMKRETRAA